MKDSIRLELFENEKYLMIKSLTMLKNYLTVQNKSTDFIDEIILNIDGKRKTELDSCETGIVINALNTMRYKLKNENQSRKEVNQLLLKVINKTGRKNNIKENFDR